MDDPIRVVLLDVGEGDGRLATAALGESEAFELREAPTVDRTAETVRDHPGVDCLVVAVGTDVEDNLLDRLRWSRGDPPVVVVASDDDPATRLVASADGYVARSSADARERLREQVRELGRGRQARRRREDRTRVVDVVREISQAAVRAEDREELETLVCERLAGTGPYLAAVVGSVDPETGETVPRAWAGDEGVAVERIVGTGEAPTSGLQVEAVATGQSKVRGFDEDQDAALGATIAEGDERVPVRVERAAAIPITHGDRLYGVLSVYADGPHAFDDAELAVLRDLCETTGHAIDGIETRRALERRQAELARQNERLDAFASVVSHDLRNPLDVAQGYLDLVAEADGNPTEFVEEAERALDRAATIVEDLLVLARTDEGIRETTTVDLAGVARTAWRHVDTADVSLVVRGDGTVEADESQLRRLLENLFRNAIEHAAGGTDPVTVTVEATSGGFAVADDGPGIPAAERDQVFEPGHTTAADGTGLGLAIVYRIVEAHGWEIGVAESADGGARFEVTTHPETDPGTDPDPGTDADARTGTGAGPASESG